jgi:HK97 family phage portal protein
MWQMGASRLFTFMHAVIERIVTLGMVTLALTSSGSIAGVSPAYPIANSMSTMACFPWVWTCVRAVAGDTAGLPQVAVRRGLRGERTIVNDPILVLLEHPSTGVTGHLFRKQLFADYLLTGNAYVWRASQVELLRLHPENVQPIPMGKGLGQAVGAFKVWDGEKHVILPASEVLHIRDISWASGVQSLLGESAIRCLHDDLTMELGAKKLAATQAAKGRPDGNLGEDGAKALVNRWEQATKAMHGAFATGRGVKATPLGWSPKEFEFAERSAVVRDVILAVFEVPPARAGLSSANYGTQKQQMRTYWESVQRRTAAFDEAFSMWALPGTRIETDFTNVESLQVAYTERQQRILTWVALGASPSEAAAYEGFDESPVSHINEAPASAMQPGQVRPTKPEEPQGDKAQHLAPVVAAYLHTSRAGFALIAEEAASGADVRLLTRLESERLFAVLELHTTREIARWFADELAGSLVESARIALADGTPDDEVEAFSTARALHIASRIAAASRVAA